MSSLFKCVFEASENSKQILHVHFRAHYVSSMFCEETSFDLPSAPKRQERAKKQLHLLYFSVAQATEMKQVSSCFRILKKSRSSMIDYSVNLQSHKYEPSICVNFLETF